MRRYTIAKTLTLFLGVLSVVARSLPERRSEINVCTSGDVGYSKQRLEELGLVMVSEGVLNGDIHTATYSMSQNTTFPKRDTTPEKPRDLQGHQCSITCRDNKGEKPPGVDDCKSLYNNTQSTVLTFTVEPGQVFSVGQKNGGCVVTFDNTFSDYAYTYNFTSLAGMVELLTSECIIGKNANVGLCEFEDNQPENPYVVLKIAS